MPDTWPSNITLDLDKLIEKLVSGVGAKSTFLESTKTVLRVKGEGKYDIEANTSEGLKVFKDATVTESDYDAQSELDDPLSYWCDAEFDDDELELVSPSAPPSSGDVLHQLNHASSVARRKAIIDAEALQFYGDDRSQLTDLLKIYIEQNRDSKDREELIAVSAAIRKCVSLLDESDMGWLALLLESGHRVQPSLDAELEVAKMVMRRYSQNPPEHADPHPELSERLSEIASDYLRPRVFARERFSTVAMLATQALIVMRSKRSKEIIDQVNDLPFAWFRQQLFRRMDKILRQMPVGSHGLAELQKLINEITAS